MKLVLFDCDGTIVDSQHAIVAAMTDAFAAHGRVAPARERVLSVVGLSLVEAIARIDGGCTPAELEVLAESYKLAFARLRNDPAHLEPLFPGARDTILSLAARPDVVLGIATGKSQRGVDTLLKREGMEGLFATIQTADGHPSKPHPSMVLTAMAETGADPARTVVVGDTTFDVEMARAAGAGALGVSWGYHPVELLQAAGAHALVHAYDGLEDAIEAHFAGREVAA